MKYWNTSVSEKHLNTETKTGRSWLLVLEAPEDLDSARAANIFGDAITEFCNCFNAEVSFPCLIEPGDIATQIPFKTSDGLKLWIIPD